MLLFIFILAVKNFNAANTMRGGGYSYTTVPLTYVGYVPGLYKYCKYIDIIIDVMNVRKK